MGLVLLAAPAVEPIALADLKARLSLDHDLADPLLVTLITTARATVERLTRRPLLSQTLRWTLDRLPPGVLALPVSPVQAVVAVAVTDETNTPMSHDGAKTLDLSGEPARLVFTDPPPPPGVPIGGIAIDILAGYGSLPSAVPAPLVQAVGLLAAHWYAERGMEPAAGMPEAVSDLVAPYRRMGLHP